MTIVIIGAGFTGVQLAKRLTDGKNKVILIENDPEISRHVSNHYDINVICDDGNNLETLEEAGIANADALVCVTSSDEVNMITCSLVDSVYPDILKIARVRNYAYYMNTTKAQKKIESKRKDAKNKNAALPQNENPQGTKDELEQLTELSNAENKFSHLYGIDFMIHPDVEAAEAIVNAVEKGVLSEVMAFDNSDYELTRIAVEEKSPLDGCDIFSVRKLTDKPIIIAYIEHEGKTYLPSGNSKIEKGDILGILGNKNDTKEFMKLCGTELRRLNKITLIGAGRIGTIVAERVIRRNNSSFISRFFKKQAKISQEFVIIDKDDELTKNASDNFPDAKVLRGDATDEIFIHEEHIEKSDLAICVTPNHEMNMVMGAYLESLGVGQTISLVETSAFADIARKIGIDVAVPLRDTVVDSIMSHLRGKTVSEVHTVSGGDIEIMEYTIPEGSSISGKTLKEIAEKGKFLVLMVKKHPEIVEGEEEKEKEPKEKEHLFQIPQGDSVLENGDKIILILNTENSDEVLKKFGNQQI